MMIIALFLLFLSKSKSMGGKKTWHHSVNIPINDVPMITTFFPWAKSAGGKY